MRGANPIRQQEQSDGASLWVQEIFYTLQGEGPFTGHPAVFIRLCGCNLRCYFCDTDFESSSWKPTLDELIRKVGEIRPDFCRLAVITGGEPFRQNIRPLVDALLETGFDVQIETNGSLWVELPEDERITIVCSPKTPKLDPLLVSRVNAYKYVIAHNQISEADGLPCESTQTAGSEAIIARPIGRADVYVMPMDEGDPVTNQLNTRAAVESALKFGYRLTLQTHKMVGVQ